MVFKEEIIRNTKSVLEIMNYDYSNDIDLIDSTTENVLNNIRSIIRQENIPIELEKIAICRVLGGFLSIKKNTEALNFDSINIGNLLEFLKESKIIINIAPKVSNKQKINMISSQFMSYGKAETLLFKRSEHLK